MRKFGTRLLSLLLAVVIFITILPTQVLAAAAETVKDSLSGEQTRFYDVNEDDWFWEAVSYISEHGIFQGTSETTFSPGDTLTRGMMVTVLGRMVQIDPDDYAGTPSGFQDVDPNSWYGPYVAWAAQAGITNGVSEDLFAPSEVVNRAQMAVFVLRLIRYLDAQLPQSVTDSLPADVEAIPDYAREAAEALWFCGFFQGAGDGRFDPDKSLTRAEAARLCMRLDVHLVDTGAKTYPDVEAEKPDGEDTDDSDESSGGGGGSGGGSGSQIDEIIYEPESTETLPTAAETDVATNFTITVNSSDPTMTANEVKAAITAYSAMDSLEELDSDVPEEMSEFFQVTVADGVYSISGLYYTYDEKGQPVAHNAFREGNSYTFALDDDRLTFAGQTESVREYHITVAREEEAMDLQLNDDILYIPSSELTGIVNNGQQVDSLDVPLVEVDLAQQRAAVSRNSEPEEVLNGYFTYTGSAEIEVGDVLSVYDGISPEERTVDDDSDENNAAVSYVKVTSVADNGDGTKRVEYESVETEEVLFLPDAFPISTSADTDGSWNDGSITVAESVFDFSHPNFTYLDLDDTCVVEKGDFIAFYDGYLNIEDARQS